MNRLPTWIIWGIGLGFIGWIVAIAQLNCIFYYINWYTLCTPYLTYPALPALFISQIFLSTLEYPWPLYVAIALEIISFFIVGALIGTLIEVIRGKKENKIQKPVIKK